MENKKTYVYLDTNIDQFDYKLRICCVRNVKDNVKLIDLFYIQQNQAWSYNFNGWSHVFISEDKALEHLKSNLKSNNYILIENKLLTMV